MNVHVSLFGLHQPGEGWLFQPGVGRKYLLILTLNLPVLIIQVWSVTLAALALTITLLVGSGIDPARILRIGRMMWLILGLLAVCQLVALNPRAVAVMPGNLLLAVLAACLLTLTILTPEPLNALIVALRPIRFVGLNPEWVTLAVALMIRSIPYLLGLFDDARDTARARGTECNVVALPMSMVFGPVVHTKHTGEALAARGLGKREQRRTSPG